MKYKLKYSKDLLYQNCLYVTCVYISMIPRNHYISYEHSWDKMNYSFQSFYSTDGTITFDMQSDLVVGAFRKNVSERMKEYPVKIASEFLTDAKKSIVELAINETFQYLLLSYEKKKKKSIFQIKTKEVIVPVVTTVLWSEGDDIYSCDDEYLFLQNGGQYIDDICVPREKLLEDMAAVYELTSHEVRFAKMLYELKREGCTSIKKEQLLNTVHEDADNYEDFLTALADFGFCVI